MPLEIGHPPTHTSIPVYMCVGGFRGPKSSSRIELSRLVQDLLNFGVLGSLWLWGGGRWVERCLGHLAAWRVYPHACTCTHTHMYTCIENCKWPLTWRPPCLSCLQHASACMCACMCTHAYACMYAWNTPYTLIPTPTPIHPQGVPLESVKIQ